jgi:hypothetical protein
MAVDYLGSSLNVYRTKTAISLKATGSTIIIPAQARRILVERVAIVPVTFSGAGTAPQLSIGTDSPNFQNIYDDAGGLIQVPNTTAVNFAFMVDMIRTNHQQYLQYADLTTSGLRVNVQVASTATTHTAHVFVYGSIF